MATPLCAGPGSPMAAANQPSRHKVPPGRTGPGVTGDVVGCSTSVTGAASGIVIMGTFEVGTSGVRRSVDGLRKIDGSPACRYVRV
jgi:hypothetical protein